MTDPAPTQNRRAYLLHCARISVLKRWFWLALSAAATATLALALNLGIPLAVALAFAAFLLAGLLIALDSWRRHQND